MVSVRLVSSKYLFALRTPSFKTTLLTTKCLQGKIKVTYQTPFFNTTAKSASFKLCHLQKYPTSPVNTGSIDLYDCDDEVSDKKKRCVLMFCLGHRSHTRRHKCEKRPHRCGGFCFFTNEKLSKVTFPSAQSLRSGRPNHH